MEFDHHQLVVASIQEDDEKHVIHDNNNNEEQMIDQKRKGKKKIEIRRLSSKASRQVAFSKRRNGLFKKAAELCCLCGCQAAVITFSGADKLFSFGHPSADDVIHRYINNNNNNNEFNDMDELDIKAVMMQYRETIADIEFEKKTTTTIDFGFWWDKPIDNLGLFELEQFRLSLERLREEVCSRVDSMNKENNNHNNNIKGCFSNQDCSSVHVHQKEGIIQPTFYQ